MLHLGNAASTTVTANKFKSKILKNEMKRKGSKSTGRRNSKQIQKSPTPNFLEANIKKAGSTASRRRSDLPGDSADTDSENLTKEPKSSNLTKRTSLSESSTKSKNILARKSTSKEQKALNSAYACLMEEYNRRREVRKTIAVKFGRANAKLKLIMAQRKTGDQTQKDGLASLISKRKAQEKVKEKENKKGGKAFAKVQNYDDPDRI